MQFKFDGQDYPFTSRRRVVYARHGMVCTSQPLSAQAGLAMLQQGGNAIDAAIAELNNAWQAASAQMYQQQGAQPGPDGFQQGPGAGFQGGAQGPQQPGASNKDNIQDADFEEVK